MTKVRDQAGARLIAVGCVAAVVGGFMPISSTSGSPFPARFSSLVPSQCHPAVLAGGGRFLATFTTVCEVTSTVPANCPRKRPNRIGLRAQWDHLCRGHPRRPLSSHPRRHVPLHERRHRQHGDFGRFPRGTARARPGSRRRLVEHECGQRPDRRVDAMAGQASCLVTSLSGRRSTARGRYPGREHFLAWPSNRGQRVCTSSTT